MLFPCKVCAERNARIQDLKEQIAYLKSQLNSPLDPENPLPISLEADGVLSAQQHIIEIPAEAIHAQTEERTADDERAERDRILSGTY